MELPTYTGAVYPTVKSYHYPKAGCENPTISLHVIGLNGPTHDLEMTPPDDPRMRWRMNFLTVSEWHPKQSPQQTLYTGPEPVHPLPRNTPWFPGSLRVKAEPPSAA
ncbi:hypothetical protein HJG60_004058 [Phyllostomus discolor]|uniref:Dipeptidylpeptidase IV N-terminal domain-containing protein n=1 Tax=Phyllostomus discolor TaxID=89673 RepID=A0A834DJ92_9CHIR|nr:hypothetical protein HJG60_004058 [Phyllostomus discolor]